MSEEKDSWRFLWFKASGKYYTEDTGLLSRDAFERWLTAPRDANRDDDLRSAICEANGGRLPGLSGERTDLALVILPEDKNSPGHPGWPFSLSAGRMS